MAVTVRKKKCRRRNRRKSRDTDKTSLSVKCKHTTRPTRKPRPRSKSPSTNTTQQRIEKVPSHSFKSRGKKAKTRDASWTSKVRPYNERELFELPRTESKELIFGIHDRIKGFQASLNMNDLLKRRVVNAIVHALHKIATSSFAIHPQVNASNERLRKKANHILGGVLSECSAKFMLKLKLYIQEKPCVSFVKDICELFCAFLQMMPTSSWCVLPIPELDLAVDNLHDDNVSVIMKKVHLLHQSVRERHTSTSSRELHMVHEGNNSAYRSLSIVPTWNELIVPEATVMRPRHNIVKGKYSDWLHYYDIHFRLLREDFFGPLRAGIRDFFNESKSNDIRVYCNVTLKFLVCSKSGICYRIQMDNSASGKNWAHCKPLMYGSLLCLSPDKFAEKVHFATVFSCEPETFAKGELDIKFIDDIEFHQYDKISFTMLESCAYYEASRHVLCSLQKADIDTMPFKEYLIDAEFSQVNEPQYLVENSDTLYDLCSLIDNGTKSHEEKNSEHCLNVIDIGDEPLGTITLSHEDEEECWIVVDSSDESPGTITLSHEDEEDSEQCWSVADISDESLGTITLNHEDEDLEHYLNVVDTSDDELVGAITLNHEDKEDSEHCLNVVDISDESLGTIILSHENEDSEHYLNVVDTSDDELLGAITLNHEDEEDSEHYLNVVDSSDESLGISHEDEEKCDYDTKTANNDDSQCNDSISSNHNESLQAAKVIDIKKFRVKDVRDFTLWPPLELVNLDRSQYAAIQNALTKEVSVIQGPPGTGKTYVGLKIAEVLLNNMNIWDKSSILVVCYTNHALDQFLEGILDFPLFQGSNTTKRLIRVGSRTKSEKLEKLNLFHFRGNVYLQHGVLRERDHFQKLVRQQKRVIEEHFHMYYHQRNTYLPYQVLKHFIAPNHEYALKYGRMSVEDVFLWWLGSELEPFPPKPPPQNSDTPQIHDDAPEQTNVDVEAADLLVNSESDSEPEESVDKEAFDDSAAELHQRVLDDQENTVKVFKLNRRVQENVKRHFAMTEQEADHVGDIKRLSPIDRGRLYSYWHSLYLDQLRKKCEEEIKTYNVSCSELSDVHQNSDRYALETADVIGMTTTGAARLQKILQLVKPKIVIVEEAAEVLEAHIVSSLTAGTQHLILIGDHKQLRPKPNVYKLARKYKLDVSLFERLVLNNFPHVTLTTQHRMRPEIAQLLKPHIYDTLHNHSSVEEYPGVKGVGTNLYFISHEMPESDQDSSNHSHSNIHEAKYLVALCKYLVQQGYQSTQITILVAYSGQRQDVEKEMGVEQACEGVKLSTIDNYQGEENDIILLSLVRSNMDNIVGFLREENRVCVALSRAKHGFYCIGNFKMLRRSVPLWENILSNMEAKDKVGDGLLLCCQNHPNKAFRAKAWTDFQEYSPHGGCTEECSFRLSCGHKCNEKCHLSNPEHKEYKCRKPCAKKCPYGHQCPDMCYKDCKCRVLVTRTLPKCNHEQKMNCYENLHEFQCNQPCPQKCKDRQHDCPLKCHQGCLPCSVKVVVTLPSCPYKHQLAIKCSQDPEEVPCQASCTRKCDAGHPCRKRCFEHCGDCNELVRKVIDTCHHEIALLCHVKPSHENCTKPCEQLLSCGHRCDLLCGQSCSSRPCSVSVTVNLDCQHQVQAPCWKSERNESGILIFSEKCEKIVWKSWPCGHDLRRECYKVQNMEEYPCEEKCRVKLECGHMCPNKCSELCIDVCEEKVMKRYPCGHEVEAPCSSSPTQYPCRKLCGTILCCGHACGGEYHQCNPSNIHQPCSFRVSMKRYCGHQVQVPCEGVRDIHPGRKTFVTVCPHNSRKIDCPNDQMYPICNKPCKWNCLHFQCSKLCSDMCERPPCDERCRWKLRCGHPCSGLCGEPCLNVCFRCHPGEFKRKLKLCKFNPNLPYYQLPCGHVFAVSYLDAYTKHGISQTNATILVRPLECPAGECSQLFSSSFRYGNAVKRSFRMIQSVTDKIEAETGTTISEDHTQLLCDLFDEVLNSNFLFEYTDSPSDDQAHHFSLSPFRDSKGRYVKCKPMHESTFEIIQVRQKISSSTSLNGYWTYMLCKALKLLEFWCTHDIEETIVQETKLLVKCILFQWHKQSEVTYQVIDDVEKWFFGLCLKMHHHANKVPLHADPPSNKGVTRKEFVSCMTAMSKNPSYVSVGGMTSEEILSGVDRFHPPIHKGLWWLCPRGHYYCTPASICDKLKHECPQCSESYMDYVQWEEALQLSAVTSDNLGEGNNEERNPTKRRGRKRQIYHVRNAPQDHHPLPPSMKVRLDQDSSRSIVGVPSGNGKSNFSQGTSRSRKRSLPQDSTIKEELTKRTRVQKRSTIQVQIQNSDHGHASSSELGWNNRRERKASQSVELGIEHLVITSYDNTTSSFADDHKKREKSRDGFKNEPDFRAFLDERSGGSLINKEEGPSPHPRPGLPDIRSSIKGRIREKKKFDGGSHQRRVEICRHINESTMNLSRRSDSSRQRRSDSSRQRRVGNGSTVNLSRHSDGSHQCDDII